MWLLARVSAHVDHQHVLGFEGPQLPGAAPPVAHELLPLPVDVLAVDVLREEMQRLSEVLPCQETQTSFPSPSRHTIFLYGSTSRGKMVQQGHDSPHLSSAKFCSFLKNILY